MLKGQWRCRCPRTPRTCKSDSNILHQARQGFQSYPPAKQLGPKLFLPQSLGVVVLDLGARQTGLGAHPWVQQAQATDARVMGFMAVEQGGRGAVAQAPQC